LRRLACAVLASLAVAAAAAPSPAAEVTHPRYGAWGYDSTAMDPTVRPGDDFFAYVNGRWDARTTIAADRSRAGVDVDLTDEAESEVRDIAQTLAVNPPADPGERKIGDLYAAWMDEAAVEAHGVEPLKPWLAHIEAARTREDIGRLFGEIYYAAPFGIGLSPDLDDPTRYVVEIDQAGLGMPARDDYLLAGPKYEAYRRAYRDYIVRIETLAGISDAPAKADAILALETRMAKSQWAPERTRDVEQIDNPMDMARLRALAPQLDWNAMFGQLGLGAPSKILVSEPSVITDAGANLADTPVDTWKAYLVFHFISDHAEYLPKAFDDARFDFYGRTLRDVPRQQDRWKRGVGLVNGVLGEEVGRIYVAKYYPPEAEHQATELVDDLHAAYAERFGKAAWMDEATRKAALEKLAAFDPRLGHPRKWIDYSSLRIDRGDLFGDALRAEDFQWRLQLSRYPKPVDRGLWSMNPQDVNAYYDPLTNQITFPAAILQPPYFDPAADPAVNYGGEGATIGHEMGHGFDDQGRHFDGTGKVRDWWTSASAKAFAQRADRLVAQFDGYEPIPGAHINGRLTLGENIGDLGGLEAAYAAWRRYVARHGEPPVIDGLTGDQRFFIAYAASWQGKSREGALRAQLLADPHSPEKYRVNGIVRNVDAWYAAFDVQPGDKLYLPPDQRVRIW
jgi:endothelin-converting enzyme/putative endopeptidase